MSADDRAPHVVFISWTAFHGRSRDLAELLPATSYFIRSTGPAPLRYLRQWRDTARVLRRERPDVVVVMQPPVVALLAVRAAARGARLIGDLHSGVFLDPRWTWATALTLRLLRGANAALVTNGPLADRARAAGVETFVVHDPVFDGARPTAAPEAEAVAALVDAGDYLLVPLSYANDEPLDAILEAAGRTPDLRWVLTGRAPAALRASAPSNIVFPGFVSAGDYQVLFDRAAVVLALTDRPLTMQRVGYEAMIGGRPLVTSDSAVLRDYFGDAAVYVASTAESLAGGARRALADRDGLGARIRVRKQHQMAELRAAVAAVVDWVGSGPAGHPPVGSGAD
jgi:hypothetical protein